MRVQWYGQSAFALTNDKSVFIDPFGDVAAAAPALGWEYPAIQGVAPDVLLVTHEHFDHNAVEVIGGEPTVLRSTAGRLDSPIGTVVAIASEHDPSAGTERGPNTIFAFELDGLRVAHFGDYGQSELRPAQATAIGSVDLLIVPVGGGPTIDADQAAEVVGRLAPRWVLPMHYRTERIGFLEPADAFLAQFANVHRLAESSFDTSALPESDAPLVVVPAAP
jgi:L-ascorbate metabolism protein UlaG (beta-lactamase superfamily)